jgi:hypothetical protein
LRLAETGNGVGNGGVQFRARGHQGGEALDVAVCDRACTGPQDASCEGGELGVLDGVPSPDWRQGRLDGVGGEESDPVATVGAAGQEAQDGRFYRSCRRSSALLCIDSR